MNRYAAAVGCLGSGVLLAALLTERYFGSEWSAYGALWVGWQALPFALISIGIASRSVRAMNVLSSIGVTAILLVGAHSLLAGDPFTALLLGLAPLLALFAVLGLLAAGT